jgi:two-component system, chemotaxis family, CheB/CheR fusion protein
LTAQGDEAFETLLLHIKEERGFDFTGYKRASLARRVKRRMDALSISSFEDYNDHLRMHQDEFTSLFNTILINVTSFFRDPDAWRFLSEKLLPDLLQRREGQPIRAWSAGCASGEEAYSLAIVFAEALGLDEFKERVKIYATDVDEEGLTHARHATYSATDLKSLPEGLAEKYFEPIGGKFGFSRDLRRSVIFGRNDILQDAPISHVDVLACRNTLMYFNAETQAHILNRLHFALKPDGLLFLGKAEMLLGHGATFKSIELRRRFFTKVPTTTPERRPVLSPAAKDLPHDYESDTAALRQATMLSSAAAQIALDPQGRLAVCNNRAHNMFGISPRDIGRPIQDLEISYRPLELRSHIDDAVNQRRSVWVRDVSLGRAGSDPLFLDVQVVPLSDETGGALGVTVIFNDVTEPRELQNQLQLTNRQLETAYEELQSTNEELETTNEELQSTVEELETTNEELQSTNEELETMNEELQSMNDELHVSNESLRERQDDLDQLNDFMTSVLGSMNSGLAVIDADLRVLAWNVRAEDLWGVRSDEAVGAHLLNLDIGLPVDRLRQPMRSHLGSDEPGPETYTLDAVNRRGRAIKVRVTLSRIVDHGSVAPSVLMVMDVTDDGGGSPKNAS